MFFLEHATASLALLLLVGSAVAAAGWLRPPSIPISIAAAGLLFYAATVVCGYLLSRLGLLGTTGAWLAASAVVAALIFGIRRTGSVAGIAAAFAPHRIPERPCSPWLYPGLLAGCVGVAGIVAVNAIIVAQVAPHTWDVMVYHLPRMAYFLQQGSLEWYPANYWSQIQHAKNAAILDALVYLASFRHDSFVQAVQFGAYLVTGCVTFAVARRAGAGVPGSFVATLAFLLSINVVFQSSTAQNDLLLTTCLASGLLFLLLFVDDGRAAWGMLCALGIGLAVGTKASALGVMPSFVVLGASAYLERRGCIPPNGSISLGRLAALGVSSIAVMALFSLPAGYADNLFRYGHPLGDQQVQTEHTFQGRALTTVVRETALNSARLAADLVRLDGLPDRELASRVGAVVQSGLRSLLASTGLWVNAVPNGVPFGLGVETLVPAMPKEWSFVGMHEDWAFIGPLSLLLLAPAAIVGAVICRKHPMFWGSLAAGLLLIVVMAARPYQPFLGRFFTILPVLMAPCLALVVDRVAVRALPALWISMSLIVAAVSAANAVRHRSVSPFPQVLALSRSEQLTRQQPELNEVLRRYEQQVPKNATVISVLRGDSYEYPFFGDRLTRHLIPGGDWPAWTQPQNAAAAEFMIYNGRVATRDCDTDLGAGYKLRNLSTCRAKDTEKPSASRPDHDYGN